MNRIRAQNDDDGGDVYSGDLGTYANINGGNFVVPQTSRRIGDRTYSVAAPRAWNRLPTELIPRSHSYTAYLYRCVWSGRTGCSQA